ncbi:hypothetical protein CEK26_003826 [Fusarium fujikuroi]|nr:hypothetical protein CEK27_003815 [Fusarium fujikuroi]QGI77045.1 hypothetical protein CEK25_003774 [Fusarium fujikuroi]QGI90757.1 hypothetical protein CEK26_003826 [Fusarium fujikuroi]
MATKIKGLILQAIEEVTAPTSNSLIKCIETMAKHQNTSADITGKIDAVRAANADVQRMTELLSNIKVSSQQQAEAFKSEGVAINKLLPAIQDYHDGIDRLKQYASDVEDYLDRWAADTPNSSESKEYIARICLLVFFTFVPLGLKSLLTPVASAYTY